MKVNFKNRSFLIPFIASVLLSFALINIPFISLALEKLDLFFYDLHLEIREIDENKGKINDIIIIDIDEKSIDKLGRFSSWPLAYYAQVVDYLSEGGAKYIAFDVFFTEPDSLNSGIVDVVSESIAEKLPYRKEEIRRIIGAFNTEEKFAESLNRSGICLLAAFDDYYSQKRAESELPDNLFRFDAKSLDYVPDFKEILSPVFPIRRLRENCLAVGFAHINSDRDGTTRHYDTFFRNDSLLYVNFSMHLIMDILKVDSIKFNGTAALLYSKGEEAAALPIDADGRMTLNYYGRSNKFRYISFADIIQKRVPQKFFEDKIILVGSSAIGLYDLKTIPIDEDYPGVELHATFIYNVLQNNFLNGFSRAVNYLIWLTLLLVSLFIFGKTQLSRSVISYLAIIVLLMVATYFLFSRQNLIFHSSIPLLFLSISFLSTMLYRYGTEIREKQKVKKTFSKYVSSSIIDEMLQNPEKLKLGGESKEVTALFSDIQNFTNLSEIITPAELTDFLKEYMTELTAVVFKYNGMLDKYIGDAIVALFGVPLGLEKHPEYACMAAIEMKKQSKIISSRHKSNRMFETLMTRIGINTGQMITGNMGSEQLFDYTAIGDNMNLAARLESLNKVYSTEILISEFTRGSISDKFICREVDSVKVKGKTKGIKVYELFDHADLIYQHEVDRYTKLKERFEEALKSYYSGNWTQSLKLFEELKQEFPADQTADKFVSRINYLIEKDPKDWDGSWVMHEK